MDNQDLEKRIQERTAFVRSLAEDFYANVVPQDKVILRTAHIDLSIRGYFILSECFKKWRIKDSHNTEPAKIAALTACAIASFRPFRPLHLQNADTTVEARCNEMFAAYAASAIVGTNLDFTSPGWKDFWFRVFDILETWDGETLEPYRVDVNHSIGRPLEVYFRTMHGRDQNSLNSLICIFELLSGKLTPVQNSSSSAAASKAA